jgi:PmbA protein
MTEDSNLNFGSYSIIVCPENLSQNLILKTYCAKSMTIAAPIASDSVTLEPKVIALAEQAHAVAVKLGITKFDIYGATIDETSAEVDQGKPKQVAASNRASITVRVWNENGTMGVTSTTNLESAGLEIALQTAHEASYFGMTEFVPDFSPAVSDATANLPDRTAPQNDVQELLHTLLDAEQQVCAAHPAINGVPYNGLSQRNMSRFYLNSAGATRHEEISYSSIYLYTKAEELDRKPRSGGAYRVSRTFADLDVSGCIAEVCEKTISHLDYDKIKSGKYLVVFSPEAILSLVGAFSSLFNAQSILDKLSLSTPESIGSQIAAPLFCLSDNELFPGNVGAITFDGEGTPTQCTPLIVDGILTNFLHSSVTAKRLNASPTGNASIGAKVSVSPNFYHISPSVNHTAPSRSLDDAAQLTEPVILIDSLQALHAGVQSSQGSFSLPFDGWLIANGQRRSVESATIAGDIREILQSIVYVESEVKVTPSGAAPHVWVTGVSVTGEA